MVNNRFSLYAERDLQYFLYKEDLEIFSKLTEYWLSSNDSSSNSENLLEASIYRDPTKLVVRDKFEFLLYFLCLQPSSSSDLHVALNAH